MNLYKPFEYIEIYIPIILFVFSLYLLRNIQKYFRFFILGSIGNNVLNILLKFLIKDPKPSENKQNLEISIYNDNDVHFDTFGMPSGHAQNCSFFLTFITLILKNPFITCIYLTLSIVSLFQGYLNNNYSILQLIIGFVLGIATAYFTFINGKKCIVGDTTAKKDDDFKN